MKWWNQVVEGFDAATENMPHRIKLIFQTVLYFSAAILVAAFAYNMAYFQIEETQKPTVADVEAARQRLEIKRLKAAEANLYVVEYEKAQAQKQMEQNRVAAQRADLGLNQAPTAVNSSNAGIATLGALGEVISVNLNVIVAIGVLMLVYQSFSSDREHWRLVLHIALLLVLGGGVALFKGVSGDTFAKVEFRNFIGTVSSGSLGLYVMLFGTLLSGYALHVLKPARDHKPKSEQSQSDV